MRGRGSVVVDDVEVAAQIAGVLDGRQLACAESCTAGLLMQRFASTDGASRWFRGGVVAYQPATKFGPLEVTPGPVVSKRAAREMAAGVAKLLDAQVAVATTGAAGPEPLEGAPPGTVARTKPMGVCPPADKAGPLYCSTAWPGDEPLSNVKCAPLTPVTVSKVGS